MGVRIDKMGHETTTLRCELCDMRMSVHGLEGSPVRYFHCSRCSRWVASNYGDDMVRAGTAAPADRSSGASAAELEVLKARLARWFAELDESDPYRVLGLPPSASDETVRTRFHELAMKHHPDHGGDPAQMRRVLAAWDRIRRAKRIPSSPEKVAVPGRPARQARAR